jgi:hypothetical protein
MEQKFSAKILHKTKIFCYQFCVSFDSIKLLCISGYKLCFMASTRNISVFDN